MSSLRRGQTLVLFALTMLLLALMVMVTIGLGVRIHERTEQQVVADAAAYSEAVVTARTFNAVSSLNRALLAQMASVAAAQSLLSWAGFYHGTLNQARDLLLDVVNHSPPACSSVLLDARDRIMVEDRRLIDLWEPPGGGYEGIEGRDVHSADYIRNTLYENGLRIAEDQKALYAQMLTRVAPTGPTTGIADKIALAARKGSPWRSSAQELYAADQPITRAERQAAVIPKQRRPKQMLRALMATRGVEKFLSSREPTNINDEYSAAQYVSKRITKVIDPSPLIAHVTDLGTSYFGAHGPLRSSGAAEVDGYDGQALNRPQWQKWRELSEPGAVTPLGAWAQDNGHFSFEWVNPPPGCSIGEPTEDSFGYLVTTGPTDGRDNHMWRRGNFGFGDYREWNDPRVSSPPAIRHSFQVVPKDANPPSIWPVFVDFQDARLDEPRAKPNVYGVPKAVVPILRNYAARSTPDPWELRFRFHFSSAGQALDLRDQRAGLSRSVAIATGLTYYHRGAPRGSAMPSHAREPPNFLNPFWRATLVASDVDEPYATRGQDVIDTLNAVGDGTAATALGLLRDQGFEAMP